MFMISKIVFSILSALSLLYFSFSCAEIHIQAYPTQIITFRPTLPQNGKTKQGECWSESIATPRADAWRCEVENAIYDPCFSTDDGSIVCDINPATYSEGFILQLTKPLPKRTQKPSIYLHPATSAWLLKLADGSFCMPFTGTLPVIDQIPLKYACSDSMGCSSGGICPHQTGISLYTIQAGRIWTATKITYSVWPAVGAKLEKTHVVPITTMWQ